jgi:hypothetical protein
MIVLAGCSESVISAPEATAVGPASMMMAPEGRPMLSLGGAPSGNTSADFTVNPSGGVFFIGNNAVYFPARSICNPAKSSYGPGTWDARCEPTNEKIKIHAEVRTAKLGTWIDFTPALRFVPSSNPNKWVWLYMYQPATVGSRDLAKFNILYAPAIGKTGVDETVSDATLRTYVDTWAGQSARRVKHFSGYMLQSGRECDPQTESDCYPAP